MATKTFKKLKDDIIEIKESKETIYCVNIKILEKEIQEKQALLDELKAVK